MPTTAQRANLPRNQILLGDCCDLMQRLPAASVEFILTDPPYIVAYQDRSGRSLEGDRSAAWLAPAFAEAYRVLRSDSVCVSFYGWSRTDLFFSAWKAAGFRVVGHIAMPKRYASSARLVRYQHESAYLLAKGNPRQPKHLIGDVIHWTYSGNKLHCTQKPTSVLTPLIQSFCPPRGLVLDPFAGSASTCVAARSLGRDYIGMEIDPACHSIANRRLAAYESAIAAPAANYQHVA